LANKSFYQKVFSSKRPKEIWKFVHRILHPKKNKINVQPDTLNKHYPSTTTRILNTKPTPVNEIERLVKSTQSSLNDELNFRPTTYQKVLKEIQSLRLDCSSGYDNIPVNLIKPIAEFIASPLTYIINLGIKERIFHSQWKIGKLHQSQSPRTQKHQINIDQ